MATPLIPQEIFLLERFSSPSYFDSLRDEWATMLRVAELALQDFVLHLPPYYRSRPLPLQPDVVWGEHVLPKFRSVLAALNSAHVQISHGEMSALGGAHEVSVAVRGQSVDYLSDWMPDDVERRFQAAQSIAAIAASNVAITERAEWNAGDLTIHYQERYRGSIDPPASWPLYRTVDSVGVATGDTVKTTGIYLPACDDSCPELLIEGYEVVTANVGVDPATTQRSGQVATRWILVERVADSGGGDPHSEDPFASGMRMRCVSGHLVPGPASGSRRPGREAADSFHPASRCPMLAAPMAPRSGSGMNSSDG